MKKFNSKQFYDEQEIQPFHNFMPIMDNFIKYDNGKDHLFKARYMIFGLVESHYIVHLGPTARFLWELNLALVKWRNNEGY